MLILKISLLTSLYFIFQVSFNLQATHTTDQIIDQNDPRVTLSTYFDNHKIKGQSTWEDIAKLKAIIFRDLSNDDENNDKTEQYTELHEKLSQQLASNLILLKHQNTSWRTANFVSASLVTATNVAITLGVSNILDDKKDIGYSQIASAAIGMIATTSQYPYISNWIYKLGNGKLLPSSYSEDEISIQSQLIALMGIVHNKHRALYLNNNKPLYKRYVTKSHIHNYADQLSRHILSNFKVECSALITCINLDPDLNSKVFPKIELK